MACAGCIAPLVLIDTESGASSDLPDSLAALEAVETLPERSLNLLQEMHLFLEDGDPALMRKLKDTPRQAKASGKMLVRLGCQAKLPPELELELERELATLEFALPNKEALAPVCGAINRPRRITRPIYGAIRWRRSADESSEPSDRERCQRLAFWLAAEWQELFLAS